VLYFRQPPDVQHLLPTASVRGTETTGGPCALEIPDRIAQLKRERNAVILAHTYQPGDVQDVADFVGDSYGLSVEASRTKADVIVFCGVMFMAETAAILNPTRKVIIPDPSAGCPMAEMIEPRDLVDLKRKHPEHVVMCYVNSTAEIKALSDICCTSSNAVKIASQIPKNKGIIFVPDKHLGSFVQEKTGHNMVLWNGCCPTHMRIKPAMLLTARKAHPNAVIMIHPEAVKECRDLADQILSTGGMCDFVKSDPRTEYVIATEIGIIHTLKKQNPSKSFYPLDPSITCPNMAKGSLKKTLAALEGTGGQVVTVASDVAAKAEASLRRMLEMSK
jgi:quinolinate synthase